MYGRARRLQVLKTLIIIVVVISVVSLSLFFYFKIKNKKDDNVDYLYLTNYLRGKGFVCELLKYSGSACKLKGEEENQTFIRYDDGVEYIIVADSYVLNIYHVNKEDRLTFKTNDKAFSEYQNKNYICSYKDKPFSELKECREEETDELLDVNAYFGAIENAISDLNKIIISSGYNKDKLIDNYEWQK